MVSKSSIWSEKISLKHWLGGKKSGTYLRTKGVFLGVEVRLEAGRVLIVKGDKGGSSSLQKEWKED